MTQSLHGLVHRAAFGGAQAHPPQTVSAATEDLSLKLTVPEVDHLAGAHLAPGTHERLPHVVVFAAQKKNLNYCC